MTALQPDDDWLLVGIISAPFGIRGEVRVEVVTEFPERFSRLDTIYLGPQHRPVHVQGAHFRGKGGIALKLEGYDTPEATEELRRVELSVPRAEAVSLPEGRYYIDQIIGLQARLTRGTVLGRVKDILQTAGNDVYIVDAGAHGEILVPAIHDVIKEINVADGYLTIAPMPGLLPHGLDEACASIS